MTVDGGVYIASKTGHASRWQSLRASGYPIIATWIDEAGAGETDDWPGLWTRCVSEAAKAGALVVYREPGEVLKGAWVEVGAALAAGRPVFAVGIDVFSVRHHPSITLCASLDDAFALAYEAAKPPTPEPAPSPAAVQGSGVDWRHLFEIAHGALICIGSTPGDWQDYARRSADDLTAASLSPAPTSGSEAGGEAFQQRVEPWMTACFGAEISADVVERNHRFLEEALELVQSTGCTASEAHQLVDYVFGREIGETHQEIGGVMVTLAALCLALGQDMHAAGEAELARIWTKVEKIRAKQAAKPKHSPLPQHVAASPAPPPPETWEGVALLHGWKPGPEWRYAIGDTVQKTKGSSWHGHVAGFYTTTLTPRGYAVESEREPGSVQIYPEAALRQALRAAQA